VRGRVAVGLVAVALLMGSCAADFDSRLPGCEVTVRNPNVSTLLALQAVPTARYTPCINALPLGWDNVEFHAESGEASLEFGRQAAVFLRVTISASCDTTGAIEVEPPQDDVRRFERVESRAAEIGVTIVPSARRPLLWSRMLVGDLTGEEIEDRQLVFTVDERIEESVSSRVNLAALHSDYVWIVDELDAEEGTLEVRGSGFERQAGRVSVDEALQIIDDTVGDVFFEGDWHFLFEGGCITYEFDAKDRVAATVAADAEAAIGFYPSAELRQMGEDAGYRILP
jgi:hypothetical protein